MKLILATSLALLTLLLPIGIIGVKYNNPSLSSIEKSGSSFKPVPMPSPEVLNENPAEIKNSPLSKTITLESNNVVSLRGPVTEQSIATIQRELQAMSNSLPKSTDLFIVLDTPGGDVGAGLDLIDFCKGLPQKVHTITLFAASMGFQIAENMEMRYISNQGTLMSHRATIGGFGGQLDGEFESRYKMIKRKITYLDVVAAERLKMPLEDYKKLIKDEYWVHGFDAVQENAADEVVNLRCGKSMEGSVDQQVNSLFGSVAVKFSKCPLIRGPLSLDFKGISNDKLPEVKAAVEKALYQPAKYVEDYILTDKHYKIF